jgi:hypothetical protein
MPRFEMRFIPRTMAMDVAEAELANALVAVIGGNRPTISLAQVYHYLARFFQIKEQEVRVRCYSPDNFILNFTDRRVANRVLHVDLPSGAEFMLLFRCWRRKARALFSPL